MSTKIETKYPCYITLYGDSSTPIARTTSKRRFRNLLKLLPRQNRYFVRVIYPRAKGFNGEALNETECTNKKEAMSAVLTFTEPELLEYIYNSR